MSKARSPRDVCSTTMGTSGLMVLALVLVVGGGFLPPMHRRSVRASDGPSEASTRRRSAPWAVTVGCGRAVLTAPASTLVLRAWACSAGAGRRVSASSSIAARWARSSRARRGGPASRGARAASRASCPAARAVSCSASRMSPSEGSIALGLDDRGEDGLAAQRLLGVGRGLGEQVLLGRPGDPQVGVLGDALVRRASAACAPTARARGRRRARRAPRPWRARRRRRAPPRGTRPRRALVGLAHAWRRCPRAARRACRSRRRRRRSRRRARAAACALTSLTVTANCASLAGEVRRRRSRRGR